MLKCKKLCKSSKVSKSYTENPQVYESVANSFFIDQFGDEDLLNYLLSRKIKLALEVGCGTGYIVRKVFSRAKFKLLASDVNHDFLQFAKKNESRIDYFQFDAIKDKLPKVVDLIYARYVYHHIPDSKKLDFLKNLKHNSGEIVLLDYFLPAAKTKKQSINIFHDYRKLLLAEHPDLLKIDEETRKLSLTCKEEHKITLSKFFKQIKNAGLKIKFHKSILNSVVDNPDLFGLHLFVLKK